MDFKLLRRFQRFIRSLFTALFVLVAVLTSLPDLIGRSWTEKQKISTELVIMSKVVTADFGYDGEDDSQLSFNAGDKIIVLEEDDSGWWTGRLQKNGKEGYFPSTYINHLPHQAQQTIIPTKHNNKYQKLPDEDDDESMTTNEGAVGENYYSANTLNLKFNSNANTRYCLIAHYMSMAASITSIVSGTTSFAWSNGSDYLNKHSLVEYNLCLLTGLYAFFMGIILLIWEYIRGETRSITSCPTRATVYFFISIPLFCTLPTALSGIFWLNTSIISFKSWWSKETSHHRIKQAEQTTTPQQRFYDFFDPHKRWNSFKLKLIRIRQQSQVRKYLFLALYLLFNLITVIYWAVHFDQMVTDANTAANEQTEFKSLNLTAEQLNKISQQNKNSMILTRWFPVAKMSGHVLDINCAFILFPVSFIILL